ncbi:hypothetical protein ACFOW4_06885 [Micromonospora sp. GCM10011542]|uniref:hypothetical protein n=1 Tax=Micromonospora sp. GCM10011542 TaxID=3317337 RepID=UPI00360A445C
MAVRPAGAAGARTTTRLLAAVPWIVVLVGVGSLVVLLVIALMSFRTRENEALPPPAPPVFLPTPPAPEPPTPSAVASTARPLPSSPKPSRGIRVPSPRVSTRVPAPVRTTTAPPRGATVVAAYRIGVDDRHSSDAVLSVTNGSDRPEDWEVELVFADDPGGLRVRSESGISVSSRGDGSYELRGTSPLDPGETDTLRLWFGSDDGGEAPTRCTVNGTDCRRG